MILSGEILSWSLIGVNWAYVQHYNIKARTENLKKELLPRSILLMSLKLRVLYVNIKKSLIITPA